MLTRGRRMSWLGVACLVALALALSGCGRTGGPAPGTETGKEQPKIELKVAHVWPPTDYVEVEWVQKWAEAVAAETQGRVKVTSFAGQTLLKSADTYDGVVKGIADIGLSVYAYTPGRFPVIEALMTPGIPYASARAASEVANQLIKEFNPKELQDTKQLMTVCAGPGAFMTKTPVRSLQDLKGMEIGVTSGPLVKAVQLLGATPVALPMTEMYEAMSRGVVKGTLSGVSVLKQFRLGELTNYITETPFLYNQVFFMVMNWDKWNSLPPDIQAAITKVTERMYTEKIAGAWDTMNVDGLRWAQQQRKIEIIQLSEAEAAAWKQRVQTMVEDYKKTLNEKGLPGEQIMNRILELCKVYNSKYPK